MKLYRRLRAMFRKEELNQQLSDELAFHVAKQTEQNLAAGMTPEEARYAALRKFGGVEQVKEECRDAWGVRFIDTLLQDLRYGLRMLAKNPDFTAVAILTLALGIGANTAIFSMVNTVLLKSLSLPYRNPDRLVVVSSGDLQYGFGDVISPGDFEEWKARNHVFESIAEFEGGWFTLTDNEPQRIHGDFISADWLPMLGVYPALGRNFEPDEGRPGHDGVVIISHDCWQRRFNSDPKILGRTLTLNVQKRAVVGVLPPSFTFEDREIFAPLVPGLAAANHSESSMKFHAYARLKPDVSLPEAQAEMGAIARQLELQFPATNQGRLVRLVPLREAASELQPTANRMHQTLWLMFGAVGLVMLVACANVSGLLLARGVTRQREFAVRTALGSTGGRAIRQLLTETVMLFICGGISGLLLSLWSRDLLVKTMASYLGGATVAVDGRLFLFTLGVSLLSGVIFGLAPALQAARVNLNDSMKDSVRAVGGWRRNRIHHALVVAEMTLAMVLLIGFGLLMRSFLRVQAVSPGFDPANVVTISGSLEGPKYVSAVQRIALARGVIDKVRGLPAVKEAGLTDSLPLEGADGMWFSVEGGSASAGQQPLLRTVSVTPDLFRTLRISLLEGRMFTERDAANSASVVVINQTLARSFFPGESPLGKRLRMEDSPTVWREIVGVVQNVRQRNLDEDSAPIAYRPWDQAPPTNLSLAVRVASAQDIPNVAASLRRELRTLDKAQVWGQAETMEQLIDESESVSLRRPIVRLLGAFSILAAVLAAVGIYGVMSFAVTQRTSEFGLRVALGADRNSILVLVLRQSMLLAGAAIGLGIAAAVALSRLLPTAPIGWTGAAIHLYGISRTDFLTYASFAALLGSAVLLASYIPARRATKVDPMVALRYE